MKLYWLPLHMHTCPPSSIFSHAQVLVMEPSLNEHLSWHVTVTLSAPCTISACSIWNTVWKIFQTFKNMLWYPQYLREFPVFILLAWDNLTFTLTLSHWHFHIQFYRILVQLLLKSIRSVTAKSHFMYYETI